MTKFIITERQASAILNTLAEFPAKHTLNAIDILRSGIPIYDEAGAAAVEKKLQDAEGRVAELEAQLEEIANAPEEEAK